MSENRPIENRITVESRIDAATFVRFALYDTFLMKKRWRRPVVFLLIMLFLSVICLLLKDRVGDSSLLSLVLLSVGFSVPAVYVLMFVISSREQAEKLHLNPAVVRYRVSFSGKGIQVQNDREQIEFLWKQIFCAVQRKDCIYLYVTPQNAYLLPYSEESEKAWDLINAKMPNRILSKQK